METLEPRKGLYRARKTEKLDEGHKAVLHAEIEEVRTCLYKRRAPI